MIELDTKCVCHIPLYKFIDDELILIDIDEILDDLIGQFSENGYDSLYMTKVKGVYKSREFDELLITIFTSSNQNKESPEIIFKKWFMENNDILEQEAFAYEWNNSLFIEEI